MKNSVKSMVEDLLEEVYYAGYFDGVGDSEDYDHDPMTMAAEGFKEWLEDDET